MMPSMCSKLVSRVNSGWIRIGDSGEGGCMVGEEYFFLRSRFCLKKEEEEDTRVEELREMVDGLRERRAISGTGGGGVRREGCSGWRPAAAASRRLLFERDFASLERIEDLTLRSSFVAEWCLGGCSPSVEWRLSSELFVLCESEVRGGRRMLLELPCRRLANVEKDAFCVNPKPWFGVGFGRCGLGRTYK